MEHKSVNINGSDISVVHILATNETVLCSNGVRKKNAQLIADAGITPELFELFMVHHASGTGDPIVFDDAWRANVTLTCMAGCIESLHSGRL